MPAGVAVVGPSIQLQCSHKKCGSTAATPAGAKQQSLFGLQNFSLKADKLAMQAR